MNPKTDAGMNYTCISCKMQKLIFLGYIETGKD